MQPRYPGGPAAQPRGREWRKRPARFGLTLLLALIPLLAPAVEVRTINDGQLVLEDIPPIPDTLAGRLSRFQEPRSSSMVDWAQDGQSLFLKTRHEGVVQLHRVAGRGRAPQHLTSFREPIGEVARQLGGPQLAFTMDEGGSAMDQIWLLDPDTGATRPLTTGSHMNNRMVWDRDGRRLAWRSTRRNGQSNDVWIMDVADPASAHMVLEAPDGALWKPVSFSRDGRWLLIQQYQSITDSRIHVLDLSNGVRRELVGSPDYESSSVAIGFDHLDQGVFFVSNLRGRSAEIGWASMTENQPLTWVSGNIAWDVTEFELNADGTRGAFVTNEDGISRLYLFDSKRRKYKQVNRMPIGVIGDLRFSPDSKRLGMSISTATSPGEVWVLDLGRSATGWHRIRAWTEPAEEANEDFVEPRLIHYPAPGMEPDTQFYIPGFIYLPPGKGPHPVVVFIHGGPESQYRPSYNHLVQMWVTELKVAVIAPNVRGSLGYGRGYLQLDDGRRREDAVHDIGALLDWIREVPQLDASRVAIYGSSYGGYMALASAVHYSDRLVAVVNRAGISNFVTYLETTQDYRRDLRRSEYGDERDPEMRAFLQSISPLTNVERIRTPLLIVQGENDPIVPASESRQMVDALREHEREVWYMNALNEGHNYEKKANRDLFQQVTFMFFEKYLAPD